MLTHTTIRLEPSLKRAAKSRAAEEDISFNELVVQGVQLRLKAKKAKKKKRAI